MSEGLTAPAPAGDTGLSEGESLESMENEGSGEETPKEKPKPKPPKMRKIKVDGKEEFVNEDDVFKDYQKYRASDKRMAEAAKLRQEAEEKYRRLKDDPFSVLSDPEIGLNPAQLAEQWLEKQLREELESDPRDKQMKELQRKLEEYQARDAEEEEKVKMSEREKFIESRKEALSKTLSEAMESTLLSKHPETQAAMLREMAVYLRAAKEQGEDVSPQELAEYVENNRFKQYHMLANQFEGDELINFLGEAVVNKIRQADLARIRAKRGQAQTFKSDDGPIAYDKKDKYINPTDLRWAMRNSQ